MTPVGASVSGERRSSFGGRGGVRPPRTWNVLAAAVGYAVKKLADAYRAGDRGRVANSSLVNPR